MSFVITGADGINYRYNVETQSEAVRAHMSQHPGAGVVAIMTGAEFDAQQLM